MTCSRFRGSPFLVCHLSAASDVAPAPSRVRPQEVRCARASRSGSLHGVDEWVHRVRGRTWRRRRDPATSADPRIRRGASDAAGTRVRISPARDRRARADDGDDGDARGVVSPGRVDGDVRQEEERRQGQRGQGQERPEGWGFVSAQEGEPSREGFSSARRDVEQRRRRLGQHTGWGRRRGCRRGCRRGPRHVLRRGGDGRRRAIDAGRGIGIFVVVVVRRRGWPHAFDGTRRADLHPESPDDAEATNSVRAEARGQRRVLGPHLLRHRVRNFPPRVVQHELVRGMGRPVQGRHQLVHRPHLHEGPRGHPGRVQHPVRVRVRVEGVGRGFQARVLEKPAHAGGFRGFRSPRALVFRARQREGPGAAIPALTPRRSFAASAG